MTQAIERAQQNGLTLDTVRDLTGYDLAEIALIRHKMAGGMGVPVENVPLRDIALFSRASKQLGLDPLLNQVHWINRGGKGVLQVGIDGFRAIADRSGVYAGSEPPNFRGYIRQEYRDKDGSGNIDVPEKAQVVVWKVVAGHKCAFTGEARWVEFYPGNKEGFMWRKMPHHMLGKAAEAQALRKAFPAQLGQVEYADEGIVDGEYPTEAQEQSWREAPVQVVEQQQRPRPSYEKIFGADEDHTAYDLKQGSISPASEPSPQPVQESGARGAEDQPPSAPPPLARPALWQEHRRLDAKAVELGGRFPTLNQQAPDEAIIEANEARRAFIAEREAEL